MENNVMPKLPAATIFTIAAINGNMFELEPLQKIKGMQYPIVVDAVMLAAGFTEQEHIDA
jgi:hypothetical protein